MMIMTNFSRNIMASSELTSIQVLKKLDVPSSLLIVTRRAKHYYGFKELRVNATIMGTKYCNRTSVPNFT